MTALSLDLKARARAIAPVWRRVAAVCLLAGAALFNTPAHAEGPVKGEVRVFTDGGYARMVFRLAEEVGATVQLSGAIMVIKFKKSVDVSVDRLNAEARDYISAARRDPDGTAIRIALAHRIKFNTIAAGERFYLDLLPESWAGALPGLPQDVVDELARRALEAEKKLYQHRLTERAKQPPLIRVRVARQPTFVRYMFELPGDMSAVPERAEGKFKLNFNQQIKWDLADAKATLPGTIESIDAENDYEMSAVTFVLKGAPELRTFREERNIIVDIDAAGEGITPKTVVEELKAEPKPVAAAPAVSPPETVPSKDAPAAAPNAPAKGEAAKPAAPAAQPAPVQPQVQVEVQPQPQPKPEAESATPKSAANEAPAPEKSVKSPPRPAADPDAPVVVGVTHSGDDLRLEFPFAAPVPAAMFRRADVLWLVFDSAVDINLATLTREAAPGIRGATFERAADGAGIVRIKLSRPRLTGVQSDGPVWAVTIGDSISAPPQPLSIVRSVLGKNRIGLAIPFADAAKVHRLRDRDIGDQLLVVTALAPTRGFVKSQVFVELQTLASAHGVAIHPIADDITATVEPSKIVVARPRGLSLSSTAFNHEQAAPGFTTVTFDTQLWGFDRQAPFVARQSELIRLASAAPEARRKQARLNLARFYLARGMAAEAKAVVDVALSEDRGDEVTGNLLRAVADVLLDRPELAMKELAAPQIGSQQDAPIWRGIALSRQGRFEEARKSFKGTENALAALPIELQRLAIQEALRSAIEVRDFSSAARLINELEMVGITPELEPVIQVLTGRLYEGLGRNEDALNNYRAAAAAKDRRAAAQGRLREIELTSKNKTMSRKEAIAALETLTAVWRGDETETEGLKLLANLYTEESRYRDAFHVMRTALLAHPNSDMTRKIQDEAARTFDSLFLAGKGDTLPPIEALGLFYDFRELTPIGRRGDEMIRRLADRLVSVDLLDQAAELLQHQVDHRLQGAARAQVATRLAVVYLMNRKPDRALATLKKTRSSDLANELREQRLLLESRALSDIGRHELAIELIANIKGNEAIRLRSDIYWAAKRWRESSEQIEKLYGERWRDFTPLNETERADILRAAVGYALADEPMALAPLREKYAAKMTDSPDRKTFEMVSGPAGVAGAEFQAVAQRLAAVDTLVTFLREMKARYPDSSAVPLAALTDHDAPAAPAAPPAPAAARGVPVPAIEPGKAGANPPAARDSGVSPLPPKPPVGVPLRPDTTSTSSIAKKRTAAR